MSPRTVILIIGVLLTVIIILFGLMVFPNQHIDFWMNLTSEGAGIVAGGLVLFVIVEAYLGLQKRREWRNVRNELYDRIYWEIEVFQFTMQPTASWHIGMTLGEDLRRLIETGPDVKGPIHAGYFIELVKRLKVPFDNINRTVTPRIIALDDDKKLTHGLLNLEECGSKLRLAVHSISPESSESSHFTKLITEFLEAAAKVVDCVDQRCFGNDFQEAAAQARFDRLDEFRFGTSWSSNSRKMKLPDGSIYNSDSYPGT